MEYNDEDEPDNFDIERNGKLVKVIIQMFDIIFRITSANEHG